MNIYFDNAATSFPKPKEVIDAMVNYMTYSGGNAGRGSSSSSLKSSRSIFECRETLCEFFNFKKSQNVIFTNNITTSLNTLLFSTIKEGWHVITSSMDHNSVLRPLVKLRDSGFISLDIVNCDKEGLLNVDDIKSLINPNTKMIVLSHGSNVVGTIQPLKEVGALCKEKGIFFIIDSAQTAGAMKLDFQELNCSALAFTGHKSLLGPQGIGGFLIDDNLNEIANPFIVGGTGSMSSSLVQPNYLPDKFESGTLNIPGIVGLNAAIDYLNKVTLDAIVQKEHYLNKYMIEKLLNMDYVKLYGMEDSTKRTPTFSINIDNIDPSEASFMLDADFKIVNRVGLHCAPLAHKTIGTYPQGTIRLGLGYFNTTNEIDALIDAIAQIKRGL